MFDRYASARRQQHQRQRKKTSHRIGSSDLRRYILVLGILFLELLIFNWSHFLRGRICSPFPSSSSSNSIPQRVFTPISRLPCVRSNKKTVQEQGQEQEEDNDEMEFQNTPTREGLLYINLANSDEDIPAQIVLRIAKANKCTSTSRFGTYLKNARAMDYGNRNRENSFLFTFVRDPTERAVRDFFYNRVTLQKYEPTDRVFQEYLEERGFHNPMLRELSLLKTTTTTTTTQQQQQAIVQSILDEYDFVGVTERLLESLTVIKLLLNRPTSEMIFLRDKTPFQYKDRVCRYIYKPFVSPGMRAYFQSSPQWKARIRGDKLLHAAANRSLELTIDRLGRDRFYRELKRYEAALAFVEERCIQKTNFPCSMNGVWQPEQSSEAGCVADTYGCGTACFDEISQEIDKM